MLPVCVRPLGTLPDPTVTPLPASTTRQFALQVLETTLQSTKW
jgi:hypothetical protein